jgi:hypothetical protein
MTVPNVITEEKDKRKMFHILQCCESASHSILLLRICDHYSTHYRPSMDPFEASAALHSSTLTSIRIRIRLFTLMPTRLRLPKSNADPDPQH